MTVSNNLNRIQYTGTGAVSAFSTGNVVFYEDSDLVVVETLISTGVDTTLTLTTDYTVSGGNGSNGTVTLVAGNLPSTKRLTIYRSLPFTQSTDYVEGETVLASTLETDFDRAVLRDQQLQDEINRSLRLSPTSTVTSVTFPDYSANKLLKWSSTSAIGNTSFTDTDVQGAIDGVAALSSGSGVLVSSDDTAVGYLDGKLLAGTAIGFTVGNPAANETLTIAVNDAELTALAGLTSAADKIPMFSGSGTATLIDFKDEDDMASDSATAVPSQQSVKAYVDTRTQQFLHIQDQKSNNTAGGTFTQGAWQTRVLNTEVTDEIGSTLSSNQFTLPAGTYYIEAIAPAFSVNLHKAKLRNITDGADTLIGTNSYCANGSFANTISVINGRFTIADTKTFEIQHFCGLTKTTDGFGQACNFSVTEIYTDVRIWKIS